MKASLRFILLFVMFLGLLPSSCIIGGCEDPRGFKLDLHDLSLSFYGQGLRIDTPATVIPEGEFKFKVTPAGNEHYVSNSSPNIPLFTQTLMASKGCLPDYCTGFIVDIDSFSISCDTIFRGQTAGEPLVRYFNVHLPNPKSNKISDEIIYSFSAFNDTIRQNQKLLFDGWYATRFSITAVDFIEPGNYRFTVTMLLKDGTLISKESDRVHFE